jgi:hypothetical protein
VANFLFFVPTQATLFGESDGSRYDRQCIGGLNTLCNHP